jgi:hypothetical protein
MNEHKGISLKVNEQGIVFGITRNKDICQKLSKSLAAINKNVLIGEFPDRSLLIMTHSLH